MTVNKNYYGYARVSTLQQDLATQVAALLSAGVPEENIYSEKMSGKSAKNRLEWLKLKEKLVPGDVLFVHKLDRLGRSMVDVMSIVEYFKEVGIFLVILDAGIDTRKLVEGSAMEKMMADALMTILSLMAQMERTFIVERTKPALEIAKANGVRWGRPEAKPKMYEKAVKEFIEAEGKKSATQILDSYGKGEDGKPLLTTATFFRKLKEYRDHTEAVEQYIQAAGKKSIQDIIKEWGGTWNKKGDKFTYTLNEKAFKKYLKEYEKENGVKIG